MKPPQFAYVRAGSALEAATFLAEGDGDARIIAGGQSLVPLLNLRLTTPKVLVDIGRVAELQGIRREGSRVVIGAATRQREAERSALLIELCPLVPQALRHVGHPQIRNRGTVGGSLAHADPASELPAVAVALEAEMLVRSPGNERRIRAEDFFVGPYMTSLEPDEVLCEVAFPVTTGSRTSFLELARRRGDFALAGVAACVQVSAGGTVESASFGACGVGGTPVRLRQAQTAAIGLGSRSDDLSEVAAAASAEVTPSGDVHADEGYRRHLVGVLVRRAIQEARG